MISRLTNVIRFASAITHRVNPNLAGIRRRLEFPRQCTTSVSMYYLSANDSADIKLKQILEKVRNEKIFDAFESLQIIRFCVASTKDFVNKEIIESIWAELKKKSKINEEHYLQLMKYYECVENSDEIIKLFDEACALGLQLRTAGYMMVLCAHLNRKNTKETWKFLFEMAKADICMDENSLHAVLGYFLKNRDYQLANKAIELLKSRGFEVDFNALTKQWKHYAKNGDIKSIKNCLDFFIKYDISLRVKDMMELVYELSAYGYSQHVNSLLFYLDNIRGVVKRESETINKYIEGGQSHIIPKLMHAMGVNADQYESSLLSRMQYFKVPHHDYEQTMQNLRLTSPTDSLQSGQMDSSESKNDEKKQLYQSEESHFRRLIRNRDCTGVEILLKRGNLNMTQREYNAVIELYIENMQMDKALKAFENAIAFEKSFRLSPNSLFDLVKCMVVNEYDFEKIQELLAIHRKPKPASGSKQVSLFFQELADSGQAEMLNKLYDTLVENNIVQEHTLYPPLIAVHLTNNNLNLAVDTYEKFINTKSVAPYTVELMAFLIERNELELLQRVYKMYEGAVTTNLAQYRLAFAYLKCGRDEKARSIFETVNMEESKRFMYRECKSLEFFGKVEETEALLRLTKGLPFDRHLIYRTLLELYCKTKKFENILNLWTEHEADETAKPNKNFVGRLLYYLKENNVKTSKLFLTKLEKKYRNM